MTVKQLTFEPLPLEPAALPQQAAPLRFVSVIVPCRNEEKYVAQCLDSIAANDYPKERMEILVVDGMSEDRTRKIVKEYAERCGFVRLVDNREKHIPAAMNAGIHNARGETVIKMDAHSTYQTSHVRLCVAYQEKYGAENVGGIMRMLPGCDSAVAQAIVLALAHRFGSGNANIKIHPKEPTWSDSAAFGCFRKELFARIGLFDERMRRSSDMDMNARIRAAGGRILLAPEIVVNYYADSNLRAFWRHNFGDGVWATYVLKFGSKAWSWRHWVPMAFVLSLLGSFVLAAFVRAFFWVGLGIAAVYVAASLAVSLQIAISERDIGQFFLLPLVFAIRHLAHGFGALSGLALIPLPGRLGKGAKGLRG